ncbi:hypothetical protein VOLCADRAFT_93039 [Volvox carteri f. nagariensis]|uniref:Uncharacterized protein n=1 Tax=Volvox carteri f. nagariensis TaxID=3068 RepID=D8U167_VOLCA|nr:uncharacterized protein VOLCADRAFT_93039 [Volvox carteri f. nagariensis]EFJ46504.1 hypothetical protein VOLCADRAFT_93039 [Volvox carteri f. nagariensis]|eukprot:XP_002952361.1 hypothetical protein VOLCADRAFT_93039 [Volvox carteri f. nagariensis]
MYYRRAQLPAGGGVAAAATQFGPVRTDFRQRCAKLLVASLPILFALASFAQAANQELVLRAHSAAIERDLQHNAELQERAKEAVQPVRQHLAEIREQLRDLDEKRLAAASRGEYGTAATLRSRMDELAVQAAALEAKSQEIQDQIDGIAEVESAVRQKQASQLLWLSSELRALSAAAEGTIRRLQGELAGLRMRLDTATEARATLGKALSSRVQSAEVRGELRSLAEEVRQVELLAEEEVRQDRLANRAVLSDSASLAANLTAADSLASAASLEMALLRRQMEMALQMQDYDHAARLSVALGDLREAREESAESRETLEKLMAAHEAVVRQRLSDYKHHMTRLERASELVRHVRDLRDMYGNGEVDDREALSLAARLSAAVEEVRVSEPPRLMKREAAEAVVREVLS